MHHLLSGRVALVTGASRGIGRAVASRLSRDGALVIVHYAANALAATAAVRAIEDAGGEALAVQADIRDESQIARMFDAIDAALIARRGTNGLDIVVNNAGILDRSPIEDTDPELFDRMYQVNAKGAFFVTQHALARVRDGGRIVFVSSLASRLAFPDFLAYAMTKGGVDVLARTLAAQVRRRGITVNAIAPGPVHVEGSAVPSSRRMTSTGPRSSADLGRAGTPDDIAAAVAALVSPDGGWITGQCIDASGGFELAAITTTAWGETWNRFRHKS